MKEVSDRFVVLRDGRNAGEGPTRETRRWREIVGLDGRAHARGSVSARSAHAGRSHPRGATTSLPASAVVHTASRRDLGIAGLLGAGRTRLLRTFFGLEPVRSGRVKLGVYSGPAPPPIAGGRAWACSARTAAAKGWPPD